MGGRHGDAVFGEGLERALGCELWVVVQCEDGGFGVGAWGLRGEFLLLLRRRRLLGLELRLLLGLLWHLLLLLGHAGLLWSELGLRLPEGVLRCGWRHDLSGPFLDGGLGLEGLRLLLLSGRLGWSTKEVRLLTIYGLRRLREGLLLSESRLWKLL